MNEETNTDFNFIDETRRNTEKSACSIRRPIKKKTSNCD